MCRCGFVEARASRECGGGHARAVVGVKRCTVVAPRGARALQSFLQNSRSTEQWWCSEVELLWGLSSRGWGGVGLRGISGRCCHRRRPGGNRTEAPAVPSPAPSPGRR